MQIVSIQAKNISKGHYGYNFSGNFFFLLLLSNWEISFHFSREGQEVDWEQGLFWVHPYTEGQQIPSRMIKKETTLR